MTHYFFDVRFTETRNVGTRAVTVEHWQPFTVARTAVGVLAIVRAQCPDATNINIKRGARIPADAPILQGRA
jgi:hypothetical protein